MNSTVTIPFGFNAEIDVTFRGSIDEREKQQVIQDLKNSIALTRRKELHRNRHDTSFTGITGIVNIIHDAALPSHTAYMVTPLSETLMGHLMKRPLDIGELPNHMLSEVQAKLVKIANLGEE